MKIIGFFPLQVSQNDELPSNICLKCIGAVYSSYKCKQLWLTSDEMLRECLVSEEEMCVKEEVVTVKEERCESSINDAEEEKNDDVFASQKEIRKRTNNLRDGVPFCRPCQIYFAVSISITDWDTGYVVLTKFFGNFARNDFYSKLFPTTRTVYEIPVRKRVSLRNEFLLNISTTVELQKTFS